MRLQLSILMGTAVFSTLSSCKTTRKQNRDNSQLKFEEKTYTDAQLTAAYAEPSIFATYARQLLTAAENSMQQAAAELRTSQNIVATGGTPATQGEYKAGCITTNAGSEVCDTFRRVSPNAYKKLRQAYINYLKIFNAFDIPIVNDRVRAEHALYYRNMVPDQGRLVSGTFDVVTNYKELPDATDENGKPIPLAIGKDDQGKIIMENQKEEWWDSTLAKNCSGTMGEVTQSLCIDALIGINLQDKAYQKLTDYLKDGSRNTALLDEYVRYYEMSQHKINMLATIYQDAVRGLMAIQSGMLSSQDISSVPTIAVVGDPSVFVPKINEYADKLKESMDRLSVEKQSYLAAGIDDIRSAMDAKNILADIEKNETQSKINALDNGYVDSETKFLLDKIEKLRKQLELSTSKFTVDFDHTFGAFSSDVIKTGSSSIYNLKHPELSGISYKIPPNTKAINIQTFGGKDIMANGIYAAKVPYPTQYGLLKKISKSASSAVKNVSKQSGAAWENVKTTTGKA